MSINFLKNKKLISALFYLSLLSLSFLIIFYRFPNAFFYPNFYAEDGKDFTMNIINNGFINSLFTRFNGYYIFGLYILTYIGIFISKFSAGGFILLPKILSIVSYFFLAFVFTLPVLLFKDKFKKSILIILVLFSSFVPLIDTDYAVIGTIGNLKFIFAYISFLFVLYRMMLPEKSRKNIMADAFIAICAYTNPTVYFLIIPIYFKYIGVIFRKRFDFKIIKESLFKNVSFVSALFLGLVLMVQAIIIYINGLSTPAHYLDDPFNFSKTVEIFIARSYLFSFIYPIYENFNDVLSILLLMSVGYLFFRYGKEKSRSVYLFGFYSIFITTFIFVITRTGISIFFNQYKFPAGFSQFFYTQNLISYFIFFFFLNEILGKLSKKQFFSHVVVIVFFAILFFSAPFSGSFGRNNFMQQLGTFPVNAKLSCQSTTNDVISVTIYPELLWRVDVPRKLICNEYVSNYKPDFVSFGLEPYGGKYIEGGIKEETKFNQSFISPYDDLIGISIFTSTFNSKIITPYNLIIKDSSCNNIIRKVSLNTRDIYDNRFFEIYFNSINHSANEKYCLTITTNKDVVKTPMTLQLSQPDIYEDGSLIINGENKNEDIVFRLIYNKVGGIFHDNMQ